jgi:hypothetical protein
MFSGISLMCFSASYAVALALEVTRLFFRMPVRLIFILGFTLAGLVAHTLYLIYRAQTGVVGLPLSTWYDWYLMASWLLAASYLAIVVRKPQSNIGMFMLPLVEMLIGLAYVFRNYEPFPRSQAVQIWGMSHGFMLLLGTVSVSLGFIAGLMYLVQSYRLKHKLAPRPGFKLPSLEWLQSVNKQALGYSAFCIALGLISGVVLNIIRSGQTQVPWTDPVIVTSFLLLVWLLSASVFEWVYKPAQQGRKVAYLTVASFVFLAAVMTLFVLGKTEHTAPQLEDAGASFEEPAR